MGIDQTGGGSVPNTSDYIIEVARGRIIGQSSVLIRGHIPGFAAAAGFVDVAEFGTLTYLTAAETMDVVSADPADAAAGTGLRTLLLQGVDDTGAAVEEVITLNGVTPVVSLNSYLRVNSMVGLTVGAGTVNAGNITATASVAATIQDEMDAGESLSQSSHFTVPLGTTFFLLQAEFNVSRLSGGTAPVVEFVGQVRFGGPAAPFLQLFDKRMDAAVTDELDVMNPIAAALPERSDIRLRADTDVNNTEVRTRVYGIIIDNDG